MELRVVVVEERAEDGGYRGERDDGFETGVVWGLLGHPGAFGLGCDGERLFGRESRCWKNECRCSRRGESFVKHV